MGLLERAQRFKEEAGDSTPDHPLAPRGLRARAEMFRARGGADSVPDRGGARALTGAAAGAGLLARAAAMREAEVTPSESERTRTIPPVEKIPKSVASVSETAPPAPAEGSPPVAPSSPAWMGEEAGRMAEGLLARAERFRQEEAASVSRTPPAPIAAEEKKSLEAAVKTGLLARAEAMRADETGEPAGPTEPVSLADAGELRELQEGDEGLAPDFNVLFDEDTPEPEPESEGLLSRAEAMRADESGEPAGPTEPVSLADAGEVGEGDEGLASDFNVLFDEGASELPPESEQAFEPEKRGVGLLARAETLREETSAEPVGYATEPPRENPDTEIIDEFAVEPMAPPPPETALIDKPAEPADEADTDDMSLASLVDQLKTDEPESYDEFLNESDFQIVRDGPEPESERSDGTVEEGQENAAAEGETPSAKDTSFDIKEAVEEDDFYLPELDHEGASDPALDPALDGESVGQDESTEESGEEPDIFADWEEEAEEEAGKEVEALIPDEVEKKSEHLFEEDFDFSTTPVETRIASQKKIDNYLSLFDISKEISSIDDYNELWDNILYAIMGQLGAESICIFSSTNRVRSGSIFYPVAHSGFQMPAGWALKPGDEIYDRVKKESGVKYVEEFLESPGAPISELERSMIEISGARLVVPLKTWQSMYGIMLLGPQLSGDDYTIDDMEFLSMLGEVAASGVDRVISRIEHERDTEELRRQNAMHGRVFSVARNIAGIKNLDDLYDILSTHLREDFAVESYSIALLNPSRQEYRIFGGNQISPASIEKFKLGVSSELIGLISNLTRVYEVSDFRNNGEITGVYTNDDLALMRHYWIVPLINLNWLVGFIIIHKTREPWSEFHRELIVSTAEMMAPVFANAIILGERESLFRDPFSPLEGRLRRELKKAAEFHVPLSLVEIRIKNMKRLIALNPQEQLAEFLAELGRSISGFLFETDFLARVSQGRYALILPGRSRNEADIFVKKLKVEFKRKRMLPGSPVDIQFSYNLVTAPEDAQDAGKMLSILE